MPSLWRGRAAHDLAEQALCRALPRLNGVTAPFEAAMTCVIEQDIFDNAAH
jgi:hypothetical protein